MIQSPSDIYRALKSIGIEHAKSNSIIQEALTDNKAVKNKVTNSLAQYADFVEKAVVFLEKNYKDIIKSNLVKLIRKEFPLLNLSDYIDKNMIRDYDKYPFLRESAASPFERFESIIEFINDETYRLYTYIRTYVDKQQINEGVVDISKILAKFGVNATDVKIANETEAFFDQLKKLLSS